MTGIREFFETIRAERDDVWRIVTDNGELHKAACALEGQIAESERRVVPMRMMSSLPVPLLPVERRLPQILAMAS